MQEQTLKIINFIKKTFEKASFAKYAVVGISGGKDSSVVTGLCSNALGKEKVFGVIMPNGDMKDIDDAKKLCEFLDIKYIIININQSYIELKKEIEDKISNKLDKQADINILPRLRMTTLYSIASQINGLVANTSNFSEKLLGYSTKWGDNVGDFAPILHLTMEEVLEVGFDIGLPHYLIKKVPSDGLSGKSDEDNFGFKYEDLTQYIKGKKVNNNIKTLINNRINNNKHKNNEIPSLLTNKQKKLLNK